MTDKALYKQAIKEAFEEEIKPLYVEREQHYKDHLKIQKLKTEDVIFLTTLRDCVVDIKTTTWRTFIRVIVPAFLGLVTLGAYYYFKHK